MCRARFASAKRIASSVAVSHACSAVTTSTVSGSFGDVIESATDRFRNDMPPNPSRAASSVERATSSSRVSIPYTCDANAGVPCPGCCLKKRSYRMKPRYDLPAP